MTSSVIAAIASANNTPVEKGLGPDNGRAVYDPAGNAHCFNAGMEPGWWDKANKAALKEYTPYMQRLMQGCEADFDVTKGVCGTLIESGEFVQSKPLQYNLLRADRPEVTLQVGVSASYSTNPHRDVLIIPEEVTICLSDFEDKPEVAKFLQEQNPDVELGDIEIPVNSLLSPAGCNSWSDGRTVTCQYLIGEIEPRGGDKHRVYLTVVSPLDGSSVAKYFVTIVRIVCENTMAHAITEGWNKLTATEKLLQRAPRRTAQFSTKLALWHNNFTDALTGSLQILEVFKKMANTKIAETRNQRELAIKLFVCDQLGLDLNAKTKTGRTRAVNTLDSVLSKAIYNDDLGGGVNCETQFDLLCGWTAHTQHFAQVNGLDKNIRLEEEKRYMNTLISDKTIDSNIASFQAITLLQVA